MVGLRQRRPNPLAREFAKSLIDQAQEVCDSESGQTFGLSGRKVTIRFSRQDEISELLGGAFLSRQFPIDQRGTDVFVVRLIGDGVTLLDFEWAREWIDACRPIPTEITSPFRIFLDKNQGAIYCYDQANQRAAIVLRSVDEIDSRSLITPWRVLWSWIGESDFASVIHAGVVELGGKGVLLAGPSGSGKSTLSLGVATSMSGRFVADDCAIVEGNLAHALYARAKLTAFSLEGASESRVRQIPSHLPEAHRAKKFLEIEGDEPWFHRVVKITDIVFPVVAGKTGHYSLERSWAQRMLIDDSQRELFGGSPQHTIRLARMAGSLPAHRLLLGNDLSANVRALEDIIGK